ncbi:plasmid pRiA4b ORF-3 family protein [Cumulibacter manganitolerans]|uniref:plasmid pRiA4b ORF-3 family protein n=1 Tax=Cumulibacter manganitolerans TaxID=1884992 RepID=UPI0012966B08|nr:plasmid pRiA4b ORF-3 family protein [Cumulibacter manganitolerans]
MTSENDAELERRFAALVSGPELADLRALEGDLMLVGDTVIRRPAVPDRRRAPFDDVRLLRVRVDLVDAKPPIWRRLELRSDLTLDALHHVLQAAFGWDDAHLHRFAVGGGPFEAGSQVFLCPFDVAEGADGTPDAEVRLDEVLQDPGDTLTYAYDYGDGWELAIVVEEVRGGAEDARPASVLTGRRAAPPEDSGGACDEHSLAALMDDPARFDPDALNAAIDEFFGRAATRLDPRLGALVDRLLYAPSGSDLARRVYDLSAPVAALSDDDLTAALRAVAWFVDHAGDGLELTGAGYLKPADVQAVAQLLPTMSDWFGKANRETQTRPVLQLRQALQKVGLLRKYKGRLCLTRAGAGARGDARGLWDVLARLLLPGGDGFDAEATLVLLACWATSVGRREPVQDVVRALNDLGWRVEGGARLEPHDVYRLPAYGVLTSIDGLASEQFVETQSAFARYERRYTVRLPAALLARTALLTRER